MKWFYDLKISVKLLAGFIIVALLSGIVGVIGIIDLRNADSLSRNMVKENVMPLGPMSGIGADFHKIRVNIMYIIFTTGDRSKYINAIKDIDAEINVNLAEYKKGLSSKEETKEFENLVALFDDYKQIREKLIVHAIANEQEQAFDLMGNELYPRAQTIDNTIKTLFNTKIGQAHDRSKENSDKASSSTLMMTVIVLFGVSFAIGLGIFISRSISKPVKEMVDVANKLAAGDLDVNVEVKSKDEIGTLAAAFAAMSANINQVLTDIYNSAEQVAAGARQVSDSSQSLSQGSTEQASSVEEITASMTQISAQTKQNAINANQANELALSAKDNAALGNNRMKEMLNAMEEINESSSNISKIIKVIDEIAFQTNILALNAAVEAARAGQHGKGFAVVAEEVRNLAARSANAAKETTAMIEGSIRKVESGTKVASETANALDSIVEGVAKAASLVGDIAIASNEQASGIAQVNQAIAEVSHVTQTNSATSEESAAASQELSSQAELLKDMVARFKLKKSHGTSNYSNGLSPEMIKRLHETADRNDYSSAHNFQSEAATTTQRVKISLDDRDFGKH